MDWNDHTSRSIVVIDFSAQYQFKKSYISRSRFYSMGYTNKASANSITLL